MCTNSKHMMPCITDPRMKQIVICMLKVKQTLESNTRNNLILCLTKSEHPINKIFIWLRIKRIDLVKVLVSDRIKNTTNETNKLAERKYIRTIKPAVSCK